MEDEDPRKGGTDMSISIHQKTDYGYLFNSMNTGKGANSIAGLTNLVSDYNSIKSGSYGKLLNAYYAEQKSDTKAKPKENVKEDTAAKQTDNAKVNAKSKTEDKKSDSVKDNTAKSYTNSGKYTDSYSIGNLLNSLV